MLSEARNAVGVKSSARQDVTLSVDHLGSSDLLHDIAFELKQGAILGIAGLPDSGKDELVECLFGLQSYEGTIPLGQKIAP